MSQSFSYYKTGFYNIQARGSTETKHSYTGYDLWCLKTKLTHLLANYDLIYNIDYIAVDDTIDELAIKIEQQHYDTISKQIPIYTEHSDYALLIPYDYEAYNPIWLRSILRRMNFDLPTIHTRYGLLMKFDQHEINDDTTIEELEQIYLTENRKLADKLTEYYNNGYIALDKVTAAKFDFNTLKPGLYVAKQLAINYGQVNADNLIDLYCKAIYNGTLDIKLSENLILQHVFLSYWIGNVEDDADNIIVYPNWLKSSKDSSVTVSIKIVDATSLKRLEFALNQYNNFTNYNNLSVLDLYYTSGQNAIYASEFIDIEKQGAVDPFVISRYIDTSRKYRLTLLMPTVDEDLQGQIIEILREADKK